MIADPPLYKGRGGAVWRIPLPQQLTTLAAYLMHAPKAHPFWEWHVLSLITLAEIPGVISAVRYFDTATHELLVQAIDPDAEPMLLTGPFVTMTPPDVLLQIDGSREAAVELARQLAEDVAAGFLVPDSDYVNHWAHHARQRGANMVARPEGYGGLLHQRAKPR